MHEPRQAARDLNAEGAFVVQRTDRLADRLVTRLLVVCAGLVAVAAAPTDGRAQLAVSRSDERVLFLVPRPGDGADSAYAVQLALEARRRMDGKLRHKLHTIPTDDICKVLEQSAFPCHIILGPADAERLARATQADAFIEGRLWMENGVPMVRLHLVDFSRHSGLAGWATVRGTAGDPPRRFAETVVDTLDTQVRAAEYARECFDRRDRGDFRGALDRAQRAFRYYPEHPSAAMCAAVVLEAQNAPADSQLAMYQRAAVGDSLLDRAWQRLTVLYNEKGDSLKVLEASRHRLALNTTDRSLWRGVIAGAIQMGQRDTAREIADQWLTRNPEDLEFLQLKARACFEGALWGCAVEALAAQYDLDSSLVRDSVFYQQIIGAAQAVEDTAAMLRWSRRAVEQFPRDLSFWRVRAGVFRTAGMADSAIATYERILGIDSTDFSTALVAARLLIDGLTIDTLTPLDTAALQRADALLRRATSLAPRDTAVRMNAAVLRFQVGRGLVDARMRFPTAVEWLERAIENDVRNQLREQTHFFLGLALFFYIPTYDEQEVVARQSCSAVREEARMIDRAIEGLRVGGRLSEQTTRQLMPVLQQYRGRIPQLRQAWNCR